MGLARRALASAERARGDDPLKAVLDPLAEMSRDQATGDPPTWARLARGGQCSDAANSKNVAPCDDK